MIVDDAYTRQASTTRVHRWRGISTLEYYQATHNADSIRFDPGFRGGDLGTFTANGGNPTALTSNNFTQMPSLRHCQMHWQWHNSVFTKLLFEIRPNMRYFLTFYS